MAGPKRVAVLIEGDFYEHEIWYYHYRFPEAGIEVDFVSRLWGQTSLTFKGHEYHAPFECTKSFEAIDDGELHEYAAVIVPSGYVADRLRFTASLDQIPPASAFLKRAFGMPNVLKGIICHGLWLTAPIATETVKGRRLVCHPNLLGDARAYGAQYVDEDVVVDGDLVTARTGNHAGVFAAKLIELITARA